MLDTTYTYFAVRMDSLGQLKDTSNIVTQKTLAPTSHNYTWQEFTIGEWQSVLYDVWGTDENNVWAVGTVMINDTAYGVLRWNGFEWKGDKKIGGVSAIFGFNNNDVWVVGGAVEKWDGIKWTRIDATVTNGHITIKDSVLFYNNPYTSIWGTSSSNLYLGNQWGKIIHWDGSKADLVSENYSEPLNDMEGYSSDFIIAVGTDFTPPASTLYFDGLSWSDYPNIDNGYSLNAVTIVNPYEIYWAGEGIFRTTRENQIQVFSSGYYIWDIEYNKLTGEVVASGAFDGVYIYNGLRWENFRGNISNDETTYAGIFLINTTIFCVGRNDNQAKIIIGSKN